MTEDIFEYWMDLAKQLAERFSTSEIGNIWTWENFGQDILTLKNRFGVGDKHIDVLGLRLIFDIGQSYDLLNDKQVNTDRLVPYLYYYSKAHDRGIAGDWVNFSNLSGALAYRQFFDKKDLESLRINYTEHKDRVLHIIRTLGGKQAGHGDASFIISFLPKVKVLLIFQDADDEFPTSVRLLYDKNSVYYQPIEMLTSISTMIAHRVEEHI
jgi:hypothetical protein